MASVYPGGKDNFSTAHQDGVQEVIHASSINDLDDAVNKIENEVGISPSGIWTDVTARLNAIDTPTHKSITPPYTAILTDLGAILFTANASAANITLPTNASVAFPVSGTLMFCQGAAGTFTIVGAAGVTVNSRGGTFTSAGQYAMVTAIKSATDTWIVAGDTV